MTKLINGMPVKHIWVFGTNMLDTFDDNIIGVYNPNGCDIEMRPGERVFAFAPMTLNISDVIECKVIPLRWNFIKKKFKDPRSINQPVYFIPVKMCFHFGLDWDGDCLYIRKDVGIPQDRDGNETSTTVTVQKFDTSNKMNRVYNAENIASVINKDPRFKKEKDNGKQSNQEKA